MEQVINKDILNCLQANNLISPDQNGFLNMRSTSTNLIECTNDWSIAIQLHQGTDIIYFDFKKDFDSVSHQKLLTKLQAYGISDNLFFWIRKFLSNRTQAVKVNGQLSNNRDVTRTNYSLMTSSSTQHHHLPTTLPHELLLIGW